MTRSKMPFRPRSSVLALEPRVLFDGAGAVAAVDSFDHGNDTSTPVPETQAAAAPVATPVETAAQSSPAEAVAPAAPADESTTPSVTSSGSPLVEASAGPAEPVAQSTDADAPLDDASTPLPASITAADASQSRVALSAFAATGDGPPVTDTESATITIGENEINVPGVAAGITVGGSSTDQLTVTVSAGLGDLSQGSFTGTASEVEAWLDSLTYTYTGTSETGDTDTLQFTFVNNTAGGTTNLDREIGITQQNDSPVVSPPTDVPSGQLTAAEGGSVNFAGVTGTGVAGDPVEQANLGLSDPDNTPEQIIVKIVDNGKPLHGVVTLNGNELTVGSTFALSDIGNLTYVHDSSQVTTGDTDRIIVTVDDGAGGLVENQTVTIALTPVNQKPSASGSIVLIEGEQGVSLVGGVVPVVGGARGDLAITDPDDTAHTITVSELPVNGELLYNGVVVTAGQTITNANPALFTYNHDGSETTADKFEITVTDAGGGTGVNATSGLQTIGLVILPNNDDPLLTLNTGVSYGPDAPATAPSNTPAVTITSAMLHVDDVDSADAQLTYTLTSIPTGGYLTYGSSGLALPVGYSFTQADLDTGLIQFVSLNGNDHTTDFKFTVQDGDQRLLPNQRDGGIYGSEDVGAPLTVNTFTIEYLGTATGTGNTGEFPPFAVPSTPGGTLQLTDSDIAEGQTVLITNAQLLTTDSDNSADQLVYRLLSLPTNGQILLSGTPLTLLGSFTQADVDAERVSFRHDGSEDFTSGFTFDVSDGSNKTNVTAFSIDVKPQNDTPVATTDTIKLVEGAAQVINAGGATHIVLSDVDNSTSDKTTDYAADNTLSFEVTALPTHGTLTLNGAPVAPFQVISQADLVAGNLVYTHDGTENFTDSFKIVPIDDRNVTTAGTGGLPVTDPTNALSRGDEQTVEIKVNPLNDAPSYVDKAEPGDGNVPFLEEGGTLTILGAASYAGGATGVGNVTPLANSVAHLSYQDSDNTSTQRQYRVTAAVGAGTLTANGRVLSVGSVFTQAELDSGAVQYVHNGDESELEDFFEYVVSDGDYSANDGGSFPQGTDPTPSRYTILLEPTNDAPTITSGTTALVVDTSDPLKAVPLPSITLADVDLGETGETDFVQVKVEFLDGAAPYFDGVLDISTLPAGVTVVGTTGGATLVFQGTLGAVQAALNAVTVRTDGGVDADRSDLSIRVTVDDRLRDSSGNETAGANGGATNEGGEAIGPEFNTASIVFDVSASNVNDLPVVTANNLVVNEDDRTQLTGISFTDPDAFGSTGNSVTLTVESGTLDVPAASRPSGYVWNAATHTLTLTGTKGELDTALANLYYTSASNYNGADQLTIVVDDGDNTGEDGTAGNPGDATRVVDIAINPVNDQPTITTPTGTQVLTGGVYTFAPGQLAFNDAADISNTTTATDPFTEGVDEYTITLSANLSGSYGTINVPGIAGLTVTGNNTLNTNVVLTGTRADLLAALNSGITYTPTNTNADASIAFTMTVDDLNNGGTRLPDGLTGTQTRSGSFNLIVSDVNQAPVITGLDATSGNTYTENGPAIVIDGNVVLSDPELDLYPNGWNNATLTIGRDGGANAEDVLGVNPSSSVTLSGGNVRVDGTVVGTFTNTGGALRFVFNVEATPENVDKVIQSITYSNNSELPPASVTLAYNVNDQNNNDGGTATGNVGTGQDQGTGGFLTNVALVTVGITRVVDTPVVSPPPAQAAVFNENTNTIPGGAAVTVDAGITLTDLDDDNIHSATVQITTGLLATDVLSVVTTGTGITAAYDPATGRLTLTGVDTKENYEDVLQSLTFANTGDDPNNNNTQTNRVLTYTVNDNGSSGAGTAGLNPGTTTRNVNIVPWNDTPALTGAGSTVAYTENGAPVTLEPGTAAVWGLNDTDDTQMVQATAQITAGLNADDVLAVAAASLPTGWTQSYDAGTGLLTLSGGPANSANVLAALSAVTYVNTGDDPGSATRTVTWQLTDANSDSASNGQLASNTVTTTLNVTPVNDPPVATNNTNSVTEDAVPGTAIGNVKTDGTLDSDPDNVMTDVPVTGIVATTAGGVAQTVTGPTTVVGAYGTLLIDPDGSYTYTLNNSNPTVNALGDTDTLVDVFTYTIKDPDGLSDDALLTITINGHTDGPPAVVPLDGNAPGAADGVATVYEAGLTGDGPAGQSDVATGTIALTAPDNIASITLGTTVVTLAELQALSPTSSVTISTGEGTLTLTGFTQNGTGPVTSGDLTYTYTLNDDLPHTGPDAVSSLDTIPLVITDALNATGNGNLVIQIVDDVPTANPDTGTVDKEVGTLTGNVVTGASTPDRIGADGPAVAGPVTGIVAGSSTAGPVSTGVGSSVTGAYGTVTLQPDGSYTYVVDPANASVLALGNGHSLSDVFTYTITDADGDTSTTTLTIGIDGNLRPVASDDTFTTDEDTPLSGSLQGNDTLGDGSAAEHTWDKLTDPAHGTVVVNPDGTFVYTPNPNFNGTDSFTYTVTDSDGNTSTATVNLTVTSVNDVPVAVNDRTTTGYQTPVSGSLTGNDTPSGDGGNVWTAATPPSNGRVVVNPDGTYRYTPNPGFSGTDSFTYTITDANGDTSTATMTITVGAGPVVPVPQPPQPPAAPLPPSDPRPSISPALPPVPEVLLQPLNPLQGDQAREESVYFDGGVFNRVARLPIPMHPVVYVAPGVQAAQAEREATDTRYYSDPTLAHHGDIESSSIGAGLGMDPVVYVQHAVRASQARSDWLDEVVNGRLGRISLGSDGKIRTPEWFEPLPENIVPEMPGEKAVEPGATKAPGDAKKGETEKTSAAPARPVAIDRPAGQGLLSGTAQRPAAAPSFSDQLRSSASRVPAAS